MIIMDALLHPLLRELRCFKTVMDEKTVSHVINGFRRICG